MRLQSLFQTRQELLPHRGLERAAPARGGINMLIRPQLEIAMEIKGSDNDTITKFAGGIFNTCLCLSYSHILSISVAPSSFTGLIKCDSCEPDQSWVRHQRRPLAMLTSAGTVEWTCWTWILPRPSRPATLPLLPRRWWTHRPGEPGGMKC